MFRVEIMQERDFPFAVQLTDQMNWGMVEEDFKFMKRLEPEGCFVLFADQERVGVATTVSFGKKGWFGNLIVVEKHQGKGAGSLLVKHSINYLRTKGVKTIGLYAYINKVDFYQRLGFEYDSEFTVLRGKGFSSTLSAIVSEAGKGDVEQIIDCDTACFGASRRKIIEAMLNESNNVGYKCSRNGRVVGYALARVYDGISYLGPLICAREKGDLAISLLEAVLDRLKDAEVWLCLSRSEEQLFSLLMKNRFVEEFPVARMFLGQDSADNCVNVPESLERG